MSWQEKAMDLADDYAKKLAIIMMHGSTGDRTQELVLARCALQAYLEAAKPAQVPRDGLTQ